MHTSRSAYDWYSSTRASPSSRYVSTLPRKRRWRKRVH